MTTVTLPVRVPKYVTPYLPERWQNIVKQWTQEHNQPVFILAPDHVGLCCPNCGGSGRVYLRFCQAGPYPSTIPGKRVYTWFDGDMIYGKGWYIVHETTSFVCPECNGIQQ